MYASYSSFRGRTAYNQVVYVYGHNVFARKGNQTAFKQQSNECESSPWPKEPEAASQTSNTSNHFQPEGLKLFCLLRPLVMHSSCFAVVCLLKRTSTIFVFVNGRGWLFGLLPGSEIPRPCVAVRRTDIEALSTEGARCVYFSLRSLTAYVLLAVRFDVDQCDISRSRSCQRARLGLNPSQLGLRYPCRKENRS